MSFTIQYAAKVVEIDIPKLPLKLKGLIKDAIEKKLCFEPEKFGKPLRRSLKGYRKLRVGDYRVIFRIESAIVKIVMIGHRSIIYSQVHKRIYP